MAPCSVERMHSSVCAPATTRRPTPRPASTVSRPVSSNASPYCFSTSGSASSGFSSGTIRHGSLPRASPSSSLCWTQTTGTSSRRAFSTSAPTFATTASRSCAPPTTPFWTSTTSRAVFGRFSSVLIRLLVALVLRQPVAKLLADVVDRVADVLERFADAARVVVLRGGGLVAERRLLVAGGALAVLDAVVLAAAHPAQQLVRATHRHRVRDVEVHEHPRQALEA